MSTENFSILMGAIVSIVVPGIALLLEYFKHRPKDPKQKLTKYEIEVMPLEWFTDIRYDHPEKLHLYTKKTQKRIIEYFNEHKNEIQSKGDLEETKNALELKHIPEIIPAGTEPNVRIRTPRITDGIAVSEDTIKKELEERRKEKENN